MQGAAKVVSNFNTNKTCFKLILDKNVANKSWPLNFILANENSADFWQRKMNLKTQNFGMIHEE